MTTWNRWCPTCKGWYKSQNNASCKHDDSQLVCRPITVDSKSKKGYISSPMKEPTFTEKDLEYAIGRAYEIGQQHFVEQVCDPTECLNIISEELEFYKMRGGEA